MYRVLAETTARVNVVRSIAEVARRCSPTERAARSVSCRRWAPSTRATSRSSPPPARSATSSSSASSSTRRSSATAATSHAIRATRPRDLAAAEAAGVDLVFAPIAEEMYPPGFQTWVDVTELGAILEGAFRPGHFRGVATVCLKLFNIVRPDVAYFGQKDAQQVEVIRRLIRDLDLELELRVLPPSATATGSRSRRATSLLSPDERARALALPDARSRRRTSTAARAPPRRARRRLRRDRAASTRPSSPPPSASARPA